VKKCPDFDFLASKHVSDRTVPPPGYLETCVRHEMPRNGEELRKSVKRRKCPPWVKASTQGKHLTT